MYILFTASNRTTPCKDHQGSGDAGDAGAESERPDAAPKILVQVLPPSRTRLLQIKVFTGLSETFKYYGPITLDIFMRFPRYVLNLASNKYQSN